jgi:hypothetical protein
MRLESPPLSITFLTAATVAWGGIGLAMVSGARDHKPALAQFAKLTQAPVFEERWDEATAEQPMKKQDRLALPVKAQTEPPPGKVEKLVLAVPVKTVKPKKSMRDGPCAKGKKWRRGGKSWRCRR